MGGDGSLSPLVRRMGVNFLVRMPRIIDDEVDGFLCPKNPFKLSQTIERALEADLETMGKRARRKVERRFSRETRYKGTISSYKRVAGRR